VKLAYIATAACACMLLFLGGAMAKLPAKSLPLSAWIFFGVQLVGCGAAFLGLQRKPVTSSGYAIFYAATLALTIVFSCITVGWLHRGTPPAFTVFLTFTAMAFSFALASLTYARLLNLYSGHVPWPSFLLTAQFGMLLYCAGVAFGAWAYAPQSETDRILTLGLGTYWFAMAAWTLAYTVESVRGREQWDLWQRRAGVWPALIALICFSWITYRFVVIQRELSRAPSPQMNEAVAAEMAAQTEEQ
jgi:hypothetical protein